MRKMGKILLATGLATLGLAVVAPSRAEAQGVPVPSVELNMPRYGGYLPYRGYLPYSGAPLGGYTPFGVQGPEAGWAHLDYGIGYDDFRSSNRFGEDVEDGHTLNHNTGSGFRPFERGRGRWNNYGRAGIIPPPGP